MFQIKVAEVFATSVSYTDKITMEEYRFVPLFTVDCDRAYSSLAIAYGICLLSNVRTTAKALMPFID